MSSWILLILGVVLGWLAKWTVDYFLNQKEADTAVALQSEQVAELKDRLAIYREENAALREALDQMPKVVVKEKDSLQKINGIGPVFAQKFNEAGIHTFADLGSLSPEKALEIIQPQEWQAVHPELWIEQARLLAQQQAS